MNYYLDLFSPATYEMFKKSDQEVSGFRSRQENMASTVSIGDHFLCYMTKLSRWFGILEVISKVYIDDTPRFVDSEDPYVVRFKIKPLILLDPIYAIPIRTNEIWNNLSFTKNCSKTGSQFTGKLRASLTEISQVDSKIIEDAIFQQNKQKIKYPYDIKKYNKYVRDGQATPIVKQQQKKIEYKQNHQESSLHIAEEVSTPIDETKDTRESIHIQAMLAIIGYKMGMRVWIPRNDKKRILDHINNPEIKLLDSLPINYDELTTRTIEQIDVLWLNGRAMARAFEIEHTTAVYSGILRMADLMALQPNMDIKLHIVAPSSRRNKVFQELKRPAFSLFSRGPLHQFCSFIPYEKIEELAKADYLEDMRESIIDRLIETN